MLVPDAVGRIELDTTQIQGVSLDGLQQHSHVWISFLFHTNTNTARLSGMNAPKPGKDGRPPRRKVFPAKVAPPALGGRRVGVFSTRSPHRPNPVGLTLVRLERVDTRRGVLHVSGLDLVNGTPVIDIKPYMPRESCSFVKVCVHMCVARGVRCASHVLLGARWCGVGSV